jgi:hypothetical protein
MQHRTAERLARVAIAVMRWTFLVDGLFFLLLGFFVPFWLAPSALG